jgi:putative alpha-1,2-mannosidase
MKLNGVEYTKAFFQHSDIMNGGELEITMGNKPGTIWGVGDANKAVSKL